jgi:tRNA(Arg) A34 adenosine deaminase TadA
VSLDLAIKHAEKNPIKSKGRSSISRFAAVLTDGYTTFVGYNSYKSSPLQARFSKNPESVCRHAEVHAIQKAIKGAYRDLSRYTLYVARLLASGKTALAKPCTVCQEAIKYYGIGKVEYTT